MLIVAAFAATMSASPEADAVRRQVRLEQRMGAQLPMDLQLRNEEGKVVPISSVFANGKPVIITPVYYSCPMLCNVVVDQLVNRLDDLRLDVGRDFNVLTYSFDHQETAPEAAAKRRLYLRRYGRAGAGDGWHFFTGDEKSVRALSDAVGFHFAWDEQKKQFAHPAAVIVATGDGRIARYFYGLDYTARDLRLGLVEASDGKIGTATDKLMLLCYDYDPATGRYSATAMNIMRVGGAASVLGLAGFVFIMVRRERTAVN
jgi:protein SCO1/2